ncbi:sigma-70 family RNA polymerase sigma factor [Agitococcus lubricus]|uniref:RNA polymerase ECF family sigma subunit n=1 Tax=Agitococcus lubricus TaxID=1077255 RepID=A0A2T5IWB7_9GAMM|nr:sigma-70 family RNA polymerase sigma factor [Agitococcus lubricus]PTQ88166.1 RNA polymerase ECF family sigma subunit [Agitococcus lubricus]
MTLTQARITPSKVNANSRDEDLMLAYQQQHPQAFDYLYQRYRQPLFSYLMRVFNDQSLAEDVYQDIWLTLIKQRQQYQLTGSFRSYLFCLAHTRVMDMWRRQGRLSLEHSWSLEEHDTTACAWYEPEAQLAQWHLAQRLAHCLQQLPDEQRLIMLLRLELDTGLSQLAQQLNIAFETLKSRFRYAQAKIQRCLGE